MDDRVIGLACFCREVAAVWGLKPGTWAFTTAPQIAFVFSSTIHAYTIIRKFTCLLLFIHINFYNKAFLSESIFRNWIFWSECYGGKINGPHNGWHKRASFKIRSSSNLVGSWEMVISRSSISSSNSRSREYNFLQLILWSDLFRSVYPLVGSRIRWWIPTL